MESDLILIYPNENKIYIIIIEVKRIDGELKSFKQVQIAFSQLSRDVKLLLSLLLDIPAENININFFVAIPVSSTDNVFCEECSQFILSKEDFDVGLEHLKQKLSLRDPVLNDQNKNLFLTAAARIDTLAFFDEQQQSILRALEKNKKIKNFALKGPEESGKTILGIKIINKLIIRYLKDDCRKMFLYVLSFNHYLNSDGMKPLTTFFEKNIQY